MERDLDAEPPHRSGRRESRCARCARARRSGCTRSTPRLSQTTGTSPRRRSTNGATGTWRITSTRPAGSSPRTVPRSPASPSAVPNGRGGPGWLGRHARCAQALAASRPRPRAPLALVPRVPLARTGAGRPRRRRREHDGRRAPLRARGHARGATVGHVRAAERMSRPVRPPTRRSAP
jgi:hypothetical protein